MSYARKGGLFHSVVVFCLRDGIRGLAALLGQRGLVNNSVQQQCYGAEVAAKAQNIGKYMGNPLIDCFGHIHNSVHKLKFIAERVTNARDVNMEYMKKEQKLRALDVFVHIDSFCCQNLQLYILTAKLSSATVPLPPLPHLPTRPLP